MNHSLIVFGRRQSPTHFSFCVNCFDSIKAQFSKTTMGTRISIDVSADQKREPSSPIIISSPEKSPRLSPPRFSPRLQEKRISELLSIVTESPLPKIQRKSRLESESPPFSNYTDLDGSPREKQQVKRQIFTSNTSTDYTILEDPSELVFSEEFVDHHDSDPHLPIYKPLTSGIKTKEAIQLLMRPLKPTQLATNIPLDIKQNVSFMFSKQHIGHGKTALCDGMGRWTQMGTETALCNIHEDGEISMVSENHNSDDIVKVYWLLYLESDYAIL